MSDLMQNTATLNDVLPSFIKNVEIIGRADEEAKKFRKLNTAQNALPISCEIGANSTPNIITTNAVKQIYQKNDFGKIAQLEKQAQQDLQNIYSNIADHKENAWVKVKAIVDGQEKEVYMTWSANACMWIYQKDSRTDNSGDDTKYINDVQVGTYSKSTSIMGIHTYNLTLTSMVAEAAICFMVTKALSGIISDGIGFLVARLAPYILEAAVDLGFEAFSCTVLATALSTVACCLVFVVVFIGLSFLWDWLNRKYTIRLQIYNWDKDNAWCVGKQYTDNAKIAGDNSQQDIQNIHIQKLEDPDFPPFIQPVEVLDTVCHYAVIIWENDNTFMEGCSMALQLKKEDKNEGFMWAFDCPRFSDNKNKGIDGLMDPKDYFKKDNWNSSPKGFSINSTSDNIPISFALDALSGADDNLYNINIHINYK